MQQHWIAAWKDTARSLYGPATLFRFPGRSLTEQGHACCWKGANKFSVQPAAAQQAGLYCTCKSVSRCSFRSSPLSFREAPSFCWKGSLPFCWRQLHQLPRHHFSNKLRESNFKWARFICSQKNSGSVTVWWRASCQCVPDCGLPNLKPCVQLNRCLNVHLSSLWFTIHSHDSNHAAGRQLHHVSPHLLRPSAATPVLVPTWHCGSSEIERDGTAADVFNLPSSVPGPGRAGPLEPKKLMAVHNFYSGTIFTFSPWILSQSGTASKEYFSQRFILKYICFRAKAKR